MRTPRTQSTDGRTGEELTALSYRNVYQTSQMGWEGNGMGRPPRCSVGCLLPCHRHSQVTNAAAVEIVNCHPLLLIISAQLACSIHATWCIHFSRSL